MIMRPNVTVSMNKKSIPETSLLGVLVEQPSERKYSHCSQGCGRYLYRDIYKAVSLGISCKTKL